MKIFGTDAYILRGKSSSDRVLDSQIYLLPDSVLMNSGKPLYVPEHIESLSVMPQLMVRISRVGKSIAKRFAHRYIQEAIPALSMCDINGVRLCMKSEVDPYMYRSFDGAVVYGSSSLKLPLSEMHGLTFHQNARSYDLQPVTMDHIESYVSLLSRFFLLKMGDYILFPLLSEYIPVAMGDHLHLSLDDQEVAYVNIR